MVGPTVPMRLHVLYWESANFEGIRFAKKEYEGVGTPMPGGGVCFCACCKGVVGTFKARVDNMQSSLRMCVDNGGERFRQDVEDFVCLSPYMCIEYKLRQFHRYNLQRGRPELTEEAVIGTAMRVVSGDVDPDASGVRTTEFPRQGEGWEWPHNTWLRNYVRRIRRAAEAAGGISTGLYLDVDGSEVSSFGVPGAMFATAPNPPISDVVILLGGPHGIEDKVLPRILDTFNDSLEGFHLSTLAVRLPGGKQHSYVALGDLLAYYDRGFLGPILEDHRRLGKSDYEKWSSQMNHTIQELADSELDVEGKKRLLLGLVRRARELAAKRGLPGGSGSERDRKDQQRSEKEEVTPLQVARRVLQLQAYGFLPRRRPWRIRSVLVAIEPHRALEALATLEREVREAAADGAVLPDPWGRVAELLEAALEEDQVKGIAYDATEESTIQALSDAREESFGERLQAGDGLRSAVEEARDLESLPCPAGVKLIHDAISDGVRPARSFLQAAELLRCEMEEGAEVAARLELVEKARPVPRPLPQSEEAAKGPRQPSLPPPAFLVKQGGSEHSEVFSLSQKLGLDDRARAAFLNTRPEDALHVLRTAIEERRGRVNNVSAWLMKRLSDHRQDRKGENWDATNDRKRERGLSDGGYDRAPADRDADRGRPGESGASSAGADAAPPPLSNEGGAGESSRSSGAEPPPVQRKMPRPRQPSGPPPAHILQKQPGSPSKRRRTD